MDISLVQCTEYGKKKGKMEKKEQENRYRIREEKRKGKEKK